MLKGIKMQELNWDLDWGCGEKRELEDLSAKGATAESIVALKQGEKNHFWFSIEE